MRIMLFGEDTVITQHFKIAARTMLGAVIGGAMGAAVGGVTRALMTGSVMNGVIVGAVAGAVSGAVTANTTSQTVGILGAIGAAPFAAIAVSNLVGPDPGTTIAGGAAASAWMIVRGFNWGSLKL